MAGKTVPLCYERRRYPPLLQLRLRVRRKLLPPVWTEGHTGRVELVERQRERDGDMGRGHTLHDLHAVATALEAWLLDSRLYQRQAAGEFPASEDAAHRGHRVHTHLQPSE